MDFIRFTDPVYPDYLLTVRPIGRYSIRSSSKGEQTIVTPAQRYWKTQGFPGAPAEAKVSGPAGAAIAQAEKKKTAQGQMVQEAPQSQQSE